MRKLLRALWPLLCCGLLFTAAHAAGEDDPEIPAAQPKTEAAAAPTVPKPSRRVCGVRITWFGDSYSYVSETAYGMISTLLPGVDLHCQSGKTFYLDQPASSGGSSGITMVEEMLACGVPIRECVVFALGTNNRDMVYQGVNYVDRLMELLGPERTVILVAPRTFDNTFREINREFREAAEIYPNLIIADWAGAVNGQTRTYFNPDRDPLHPTLAGYRLWLDTIYAVLPCHVTPIPLPGSTQHLLLRSAQIPERM